MDGADGPELPDGCEPDGGDGAGDIIGGAATGGAGTGAGAGAGAVADGTDSAVEV